MRMQWRTINYDIRALYPWSPCLLLSYQKARCMEQCPQRLPQWTQQLWKWSCSSKIHTNDLNVVPLSYLVWHIDITIIHHRIQTLKLYCCVETIVYGFLAYYPYENNPTLFLFYVYFNAITSIFILFFFGPCPILLLFYCTSKIGPLFYLCFHLILILFYCKIYYKRCILLLFFCTSWKIACKIVCFNPILQTDGPKHVYFIAIFQNRLKNSMQNSLF